MTGFTYENVVILRPVRPNVAVHAGSIQANTLTTTMIAKLDQKSKPRLGPTMPVDNVATAMFVLSLQVVSQGFRLLIKCLPEGTSIPHLGRIVLSCLFGDSFDTSGLD